MAEGSVAKFCFMCLTYVVSKATLKTIQEIVYFFLRRKKFILSRRKGRYQRRKDRRLSKKQELFSSVGTVNEIYNFHDMYKYGKKCCNGVRWKQSTQNFERHLISITAANVDKCRKNTWKPSKYIEFSITERGKKRNIEAPLIRDRQVHKIVTDKILYPFYLPSMIYNNGASIKGKGLSFSQQQLKQHLSSHYRKYGNEGTVLLIDFSNFFASVHHEDVLNRHKRYLPENLRFIPDSIITKHNKKQGLPLGVEPSQMEMVAFPSSLDNYIQCQLSLGRSGHYMDDYYILIPPDRDVKSIKDQILSKINEIGLVVNPCKTKTVPLYKSFKFCKTTYLLTSSGKIVSRKNRDSLNRCKRKLNKIHSKYYLSELDYNDIWSIYKSTEEYYSKTNNHSCLIELYSKFLHLFKCNLDSYYKLNVSAFIHLQESTSY